MSQTDGQALRQNSVLPALAIVALAVGLRAWHVSWGLPDFTEEAIPLHLALKMRSVATGALSANPHAFNYPSLGIYLHLAIQQLIFLIGQIAGRWQNAADFQLAFYVDPTPTVLAARWLGIVCDACGVLAAWRIGRRFSAMSAWSAAVLIACSMTSIVTARSIYVDSPMACLSLWALERMLAWRERGRSLDHLLAAVLIGLATGCKYPAVFLLLPLGILTLLSPAPRRLRLVVLASVVALLTFLITTPFALLDLQALIRDLRFEARHTAEGHFGSVGHVSFGYQLTQLIRDIGWPAFLILLASPLLLFRSREARVPGLTLWLALLAFGVPIAMTHIDATRYLLPVVQIAAVLIGLSVAQLTTLIPIRSGAATGLLALALIGPPVVAGIQTARAGASDTQVEARKWCEEHVSSGAIVLSEGYGPRLASSSMIARVKEGEAYRLASPAWRDRVNRMPAYNIVVIPLVTSARITMDGPGNKAPARSSSQIASESVMAAFYEPALYAGVDWLITTGAVRGRFEADTVRYPAAHRFYAFLSKHANAAAHFSPGPTSSGSEITIYALTPNTRRAMREAGELRSEWWRLASRVEGSPSRPDAPRPFEAELQVSDIAQQVSPDSQRVYQSYIATFADEMARVLVERGRFDDAIPFASSNAARMPTDVQSCLLASVAFGRTQNWTAARRCLERTFQATSQAEPDPMLQIQYARALAHTGDVARSASEYRRLLDRLPPGEPLAVAARGELEKLH